MYAGPGREAETDAVAHSLRTRRTTRFPARWGRSPADTERRAGWIINRIAQDSLFLPRTAQQRLVELRRRPAAGPAVGTLHGYQARLAILRRQMV